MPHTRQRPPLHLDRHDAARAHARFGANCGPGALAAVAGCTIEAAVHAIPGFIEKGYTKEFMMTAGLEALGATWSWLHHATDRTRLADDQAPMPAFGLIRLVWTGPWLLEAQGSGFGTDSRSMMPAWERSHWIATWSQSNRDNADIEIFDINALHLDRTWLPHCDWAALVAAPLATTVADSWGGWLFCDAIRVTPSPMGRKSGNHHT